MNKKILEEIRKDMEEMGFSKEAIEKHLNELSKLLDVENKND